MTCLLAAATPFEIAIFLDRYRAGNLFPDKQPVIDILLTGIGLTAATYHIQKQVALKRPDIVIQAGIAGCFDRSFSPGDTVVIRQDAIADQGMVEANNLKTLFDLGLLKPGEFPYKKGWLQNPHMDLLKKTGLKKVNAISVNQISTSKRTIGQYMDRFQPVVESMEGAALHYTCLMENIPFLQLRSISNYIGERDKKKWKMKESIVNLNQELIRLLTSIKSGLW